MLYVLAAPLALSADGCRYVSFSKGQATAAIQLDAIWLLIQLLGMAVIGPGLIEALGAWALGALVGTAAWLLVNDDFRAGIMIAPRAAFDTFRPLGQGQRLALTGEAIINSVLRQAINWLSLALFGIAAAAALRGVFTLFGPLFTAALGLRVAVIPRLRKLDDRKCRSTSLLLALLVSVFALGTGALLLRIPDSWGVRLLGDSWTLTSQIVVPATATFTLWSLDNAGFLYFAGRGRIGRITRIKLLVAVAQLSGVAAGALGGNGVVALMYGLALGSCVGTAIWLFSMRFATNLAS